MMMKKMLVTGFCLLMGNASYAQQLWGMTLYGGTDDNGVLFQYSPATATYTKKIDFSRPNERWPYGSLIRASDGKFYGMTKNGGTTDDGVLFQYDPATSTYTKKVEFDGINGRYPQGSLIQASDGKLYGMTWAGGTNNLGVLYQSEILNSPI